MKASLAFAAALLAGCTAAPKPASQNPSPMAETVRAHQRVEKTADVSSALSVRTGDISASVFVTPEARQSGEADLVIHFHGAAYIPIQAAAGLKRPLVVTSLHLGAGGGLYEQRLADPATFPALLAAIEQEAAIRPRRRFLTGFSAGYGAIRAILRTHYDAVDGVLLLDGLHTSYVPERKPLAEGGVLDESKLEPFLRIARDAAEGRKRLVITHSEIFPGTFASTTETASWLLQKLELKAQPVLQWGPGGMQQISEAKKGSLHILGFAGNTAPDHLDHLHGYEPFLRLLLTPGA